MRKYPETVIQGLHQHDGSNTISRLGIKRCLGIGKGCINKNILPTFELVNWQNSKCSRYPAVIPVGVLVEAQAVGVQAVVHTTEASMKLPLKKWPTALKLPLNLKLFWFFNFKCQSIPISYTVSNSFVTSDFSNVQMTLPAVTVCCFCLFMWR